MRPRRAIVLLVGLLAGCAYEAPRLQPDRTVPQHVAEKGLWSISDKVEYTVAISGRRVDDRRLREYLEETSCRVAGPYCDAIRTYPIIAPDFNASMSPNGFMQVWTGLLLRAENEAQMASVLGHEVMHYVERHSLERLETTRRTANLAMAAQFGLLMGGIYGVQSGPVSVNLGDVTSLVAGGYLASYSREHEEQSDREGLELIRKAGYATGEASRVWQNLIAEQEECDLPSPPALLASHPASKTRMEYLQQMAAAHSGGETGEDRFLEVILPHRASWIRAELSLRSFCRIKVVLERLLKQGANPGELYYFLGEVHRLRNDPEENDLVQAIDYYRKAVQAQGVPVEAHRELGFVLRRAQRTSEARAALERYLALAPAADDAEMIRKYLAKL